jgi:hypothetical protein
LHFSPRRLASPAFASSPAVTTTRAARAIGRRSLPTIDGADRIISTVNDAVA